jgi:hypothetical protein
VTAIPQGSCAHASADALNLWSVQNKQDYAQLNGYEFHLSAHDVALAVKVTFNLPALCDQALIHMKLHVGRTTQCQAAF